MCVRKTCTAYGFDCDGVCLGDADGDGICDEEDTCFGDIDECGVCNGTNVSGCDDKGVQL